MSVLALAICLSLTFIASVHFYWAAGGSAGKAGAIPFTKGRAVLTPGRAPTALVGFALLAMAGCVGATAGILPRYAPLNLLQLASGGLAFIFAARAVGDFRYVGFFKKVRGTVFARRDTYFYSPLCLSLACGIAAVALA